MNSLLRAGALAALILTSACSTVIEGRTQRIAVDTIPSGASCQIKDNDIVLAKVTTPGTAEIEKSKNDILVECTKEGYITNKLRNRSDIAISSIGNMALGQWSFIGNAVDSASGASHKYDSRVFIAMNPLPPVALEQPASPTATGGALPATALAGLPANQLAQQLSMLFNTPNVIVSHQSPDEVMHMLANNQMAGNAASDPAANAQELAILTADRTPIQHSAE